MLTIEECRKILNKDGIEYTEEEIREIRDVLILFTELSIENLNRIQYDEKLRNLYKSINGRTGGQRIQPERPGAKAA